MKNLFYLLLFVFALPQNVSANSNSLESPISEEVACNWNFTFNMNSGKRYPYNSNVYVKANPSKRQDIEWMELYMNGQYVRKESSYPYEWGKSGGNDNYLKNMKAGTYTLKIR